MLKAAECKKKDRKNGNGADDNASGVAALLELARNFAIRNYKPLYTLVFVAFDAEEVGLYGSTAFSTLFAERPESVRLMVSMDMVGRLHDGALEFQGTGTLKDCAQRLNRAAEKNNIRISTKKFETTPLIATDTEPFAKLGIPTLAVSTGIHEDYHTPQDTPEKIDYEGLVKVVGMMADFVLSLDTEEGAVSTGKLSYKHRNARGVFDWGPTAAIGSSYHSYPKSAVEGKSARAWNVGLWAQASGRHLAVRTSLVYDKRKAQAPSDPTDIFSTLDLLPEVSEGPIIIGDDLGEADDASRRLDGIQDGFRGGVAEPVELGPGAVLVAVLLDFYQEVVLPADDGFDGPSGCDAFPDLPGGSRIIAECISGKAEHGCAT